MANRAKIRGRRVRGNVHMSIFQGGARVQSIANREPVPTLRRGQFGATPRAEMQVTAHEKRWYEENYDGIETWHWTVFADLGRIKLVLAHKDGKYKWVQVNYVMHRLEISCFYAAREDAIWARETNSIAWSTRVDGV